MIIDTKDMLKSILTSISQINYVEPGDIPNIDLYMDQVTTFMEEHLRSSKRYEDDKVLTKTMINNYAKNNLLPPPVKKKYSKEHVLVMIFIYYFKNILSIKDIETLLTPITDKYFKHDSGIDITFIYNEVMELEKSRIDVVTKDIAKSFKNASECFSDVPEEEQDYLQLFAFICSLSFDIYVKKLLMQKLIDEFDANDNRKDRKKKQEVILISFLYHYIKLDLITHQFSQTPYHSRHSHSSMNG